jgi:hypothetical protein
MAKEFPKDPTITAMLIGDYDMVLELMKEHEKKENCFLCQAKDICDIKNTIEGKYIHLRDINSIEELIADAKKEVKPSIN